MNYNDNITSINLIEKTKAKILEKYEDYYFDYNLLSTGIDLNFEIIATSNQKDFYDIQLIFQSTNKENFYIILICDYYERKIENILINSNNIVEAYLEFEKFIFKTIKEYLMIPNF